MRRDWTDAIAAHRGEPCAVCGLRLAIGLGCVSARRLELAHLLGRKYDRPLLPPRSATLYVHPDSVVMLCGPSTDRHSCHGRFDGHELDLRPYLSPDQLTWAVERIGNGPAMRALAGRDWI